MQLNYFFTIGMICTNRLRLSRPSIEGLATTLRRFLDSVSLEQLTYAG